MNKHCGEFVECNNAEGCFNCKYNEEEVPVSNYKFLLPLIVAGVVLLAIFFLSMAHAEEVNVNALANAIYKAENSVKYPYGIKSINTCIMATKRHWTIV